MVRLKSGDPFVLGRGGEEVLALAQAGIPCEVVPGVSSALAAPSLAGIPLTHRGLASGFAVVSGHAAEVYQPVLDQLPPGGLTLVVLMGLTARAAIARLLLDRGWNPTTPAAVLLAASTPSASVWTGTLRALASAEIPAQTPGAPGTLVIGAVVSVAEAAAAALEPGPAIEAAGHS